MFACIFARSVEYISWPVNAANFGFARFSNTSLGFIRVGRTVVLTSNPNLILGRTVLVGETLLVDQTIVVTNVPVNQTTETNRFNQTVSCDTQTI